MSNRQLHARPPRLPGESPCHFTHGAEGWGVCDVHGWTGDMRERSRVLVCPCVNDPATHTPPAPSDALAAALAEIEDWKAGRRSYLNLGPYPPYTPDVIAVMDAQEVVKLAAYISVLRANLPALEEAS